MRKGQAWYQGWPVMKGGPHGHSHKGHRGCPGGVAGIRDMSVKEVAKVFTKVGLGGYTADNYAKVVLMHPDHPEYAVSIAESFAEKAGDQTEYSFATGKISTVGETHVKNVKAGLRMLGYKV